MDTFIVFVLWRLGFGVVSEGEGGWYDGGNGVG